jgi:hypothetical protein
MILSFNSLIDILRKIEEVPDRIYFLLLAIVFFSGINLWIKNIKGRKSYLTQLIETFKDLISYLIGEGRGNVVQKINALLGLVLLLCSLVFLFLYAHSYYVQNSPSTTFLVILVSSVICLFVTVPLCAKYTRYRYSNL